MIEPVSARNYTLDEKRKMYAAGYYVFDTIMGDARGWTEEAWIDWIDECNGWRPAFAIAKKD